MVLWYWSVDTLFWRLSINHNMDVTQGSKLTFLLRSQPVTNGINLVARWYDFGRQLILHATHFACKKGHNWRAKTITKALVRLIKLPLLWELWSEGDNFLLCYFKRSKAQNVSHLVFMARQTRVLSYFSFATSSILQNAVLILSQLCITLVERMSLGTLVRSTFSALITTDKRF